MKHEPRGKRFAAYTVHPPGHGHLAGPAPEAPPPISRWPAHLIAFGVGCILGCILASILLYVWLR